MKLSIALIVLGFALSGCGGGSTGIVPMDPNTSVTVPTPDVSAGSGTSGPPVSGGVGSSTDPAPDPGDADAGSSHGDSVEAGGSGSSGAPTNQSPGGSGHS